MKKTILALAVAGVFSGAALAQSSVSLSGIVDLSLQSKRDTAGNTTNGINDGKWDSSRFTLQGKEDLGNNLGATFFLQNRFNAADTGQNGNSGTAGSSQASGTPIWTIANVGLTGGFGSITLGRQTAITDDTYWDTASGFHAQRGSALDGAGGNPWLADNAIKWNSANFGGLTVRVLYGFGEVAGNNSNKSWAGLGVGYAQGPFTFDIGYDQYNALATETAVAGGFTHSALAASPSATTTEERRKALGLVAAYDFGAAKVGFNYDTYDSGISGWNKEQRYGLGVKVPLADNRAFVRLDIGQTRNVVEGATDANGNAIANTYTSSGNKDNYVSLAGAYNLSPRTAVYAGYSRDKDNGANNSVNLFAVGLHHTF